MLYVGDLHDIADSVLDSWFAAAAAYRPPAAGDRRSLLDMKGHHIEYGKRLVEYMKKMQARNKALKKRHRRGA
jgi:hypothetical protein